MAARKTKPKADGGPPAVQPPRVFISYSSLDRSAAFEVMDLLEQHECDVWLDFFDIKPAEVLTSELADNLERADVACILLSPTSVESRWVGYEIDLALKKQPRLRVLPVILRPCVIPDRMGDLVGVDMSAGSDDEASRLRLLRAVLGTSVAEDAVLLSAGRRAELAKAALRAEAELAMPSVANELARLRDDPVDELAIDVAMDGFPLEEEVIVELKLTIDPLFSQPMSFFFARYREGRTWPEGFDFAERPYTEYFKGIRPRLDCKFTWFDRVEEPSLVLSDLADEASFILEMDGSTFTPGGPGPHLPQDFRIASLASLFSPVCRFELIAHHPSDRTAKRIDLAKTDIDIRVHARPANVRLFSSRHSSREQTISSCNHLSQIESEIEREVMLGLAAVSRDPARDQRVSEERDRLREVLDSDAPVEDRDRRTLARMAFHDAWLATVQGDFRRSSLRFERAALLLEPVVLESYPTYEEGMLMYRACEGLLGYFLKRRNFAGAADFSNGVALVAQRLLDLQPEEPDYSRIFADALRLNALVKAENGDLATAADYLLESTEIWRSLYRGLPSRERLVDFRQSYARAVELAQRWDLRLPLDEWRREVDAEGALDEAVRTRQEIELAPPVWLQPVELEKWPCVPFDSPLLRYAVRLPKRWRAAPELVSTGIETTHVFRGPWPSELLVVSVIDKASGAGTIQNWVEAVVAMIGFPVLEMTTGGVPKLLEWEDLGPVDTMAERHQLDETRAYVGFAVLPGQDRHMARLYLLLARRGTFAWKIVLSFESACLPGTPLSVVAAQDHVRAGAVLGHLLLS